MLADTEIYFFLQNSLPAKQLIPQLHTTLLEQGVMIDDECYYTLNDWKSFDFDELVPVRDPLRTIESICNWPTLGWLEYYIIDPVLVMFHGFNYYEIDVIMLSIRTRGWDYDEIKKQNYLQIIHYLHQHLHAVWTVGGWNLEDQQQFDWKKLLPKARNGIFEEKKEYEIDLRKSF
ncbi:MAG: hypothetical protein GY810_22315 [Aureispira sp.]|nr:hypothetical protein [Aureispira sp.]